MSPIIAHCPRTGKPREFRAGDTLPAGWLVQSGREWDTVPEDSLVVVRVREGNPYEDEDDESYLSWATPAQQAAHVAKQAAAAEAEEAGKLAFAARVAQQEEAAKATAIRLVAVRATLAKLATMPEEEVGELLRGLTNRPGISRWSAADGRPREADDKLILTIGSWGSREDTGHSYYHVAAGLTLDGQSIAAHAETCAAFLNACPRPF